ncbi:MAG: helix-turn-helix transcriptional regulator [Alphaproteobacteria bacterium]|nr:helix-turn-helix transcriptional regulator [Alphaproteobacteria bacterium]
MSARPTKTHLRLGRHHAEARLHRRESALHFWEFVHAPRQPLPEHTHDRAHACLLLAGSFQEISGDDSRAVSAGTILLHPRGAKHKNVIGETGAHSLAIEFDDDYLARLCPQHLDRLGSTLISGAPDIIRAGVAVHRLLRDAAPPARVRRAVDVFLKRLLGDEPAAPRWIADVKRQLEAGSTPDLGDIGRHVGRHPAHIMREFRRSEGVPVGEYRRALRIARACKMLRQTIRPIAEIALACGFADQSHLTRTFKRFVNMTPAAYRNA